MPSKKVVTSLFADNFEMVQRASVEEKLCNDCMNKCVGRNEKTNELACLFHFYVLHFEDANSFTMFEQNPDLPN